MRRWIVAFFGVFVAALGFAATEEGCLSCHKGIEAIMPPESPMMQQIQALGAAAGDPEGCVVCHGGNPTATTKEEAHTGAPEMLANGRGPKTFYPDPGSIWISERTCGQCHAGYTYRLNLSLMQTEAGKIAGNLHTWGLPEAQDGKVPYGNYAVTDTDGPVPQVGTEAYKQYMQELIARYPHQFPDHLEALPNPSVEEIEKDPKLAALTYQRHECQRCHVGVNGREKRGDWRGMGCSSCHIPYSNEGFYEGNDPTIPKDQPGHPLVHRIQSTREVKVQVGELEYSGIPVETCNSCHNRGKRIGVTFQGLMEFPYGSPFNEAGEKQPKHHTKQYLFIADDVHHRGEPGKGGMLCQDCHTTIEMHGDGNIPGTTLAQVEIECTDCHGTPDKYPWELPLGFGEEFGRELPDVPRGLADEPLPESNLGTRYPKGDGYLLTARGNPFGNVVKQGDKVILHSATGSDFEVPLLKTINENDAWSSPDAKVAMVSVKGHAENLECYACHASWVPQCYGCHVKVDYSGGKSSTDWVASGTERYENGQTAESAIGSSGIKSPGKVSETRSYLRWEDPVLGINGEGRVSPLMPGCQVAYTVIDREGNTIAHNVIARSPDEAAQLGQDFVPLAIDMAPAQPHSVLPQARSCESCHNNPKTLGYGINNGIFQNQYARDIVVDLIDAKTGQVIPQKHQVQIPAIPDLQWDWSQIIDPETDVQVQTVGTHWPLSRALPKEMREAMDRTGLCMGCHREMTNEEVWSKVSTPGKLSNDEHIELMHRTLLEYLDRKQEQ